MRKRTMLALRYTVLYERQKKEGGAVLPNHPR